jgi:hypothetical protein
MLLRGELELSNSFETLVNVALHCLRVLGLGQDLQQLFI